MQALRSGLRHRIGIECPEWSADGAIFNNPMAERFHIAHPERRPPLIPRVAGVSMMLALEGRPHSQARAAFERLLWSGILDCRRRLAVVGRSV